MAAIPLYAQLINLFAAFLLLLAFAMLAQRRVLSLINLFAMQGFAGLILFSVYVLMASGSPSSSARWASSTWRMANS